MDENNPQIRHETTDIDIWPVIKTGIWLAAVCVVSLALMWGVYRYFQNENPSTAAKPTIPAEVFPQPRLEERPVEELKAVVDSEVEHLTSYGWVDQPKGVVRIPIDRAIEILAQRGLPARKDAPAVSKISVPGESGLGVQ